MINEKLKMKKVQTRQCLVCTKVKSKKRSLSILFLAGIFFCLFFSNGTKAARLYFELDKKEIGIGDVFEAQIFLDTESEIINAIDLNVGFSSDALKYKDFSDGNSVISFWVARPKNDSSSKNLVGIVANGFEGKNGLLGSLSFEAIKDGMAKIFFEENSKIAKNDGKGELAKVSFPNLEFLIGVDSDGIVDNKNDTVLPESFLPLISQENDFLDGKYFLSFATSDKDSGIDHYEVKEGDNDFVLAESPYILKNQKLNQEIQVMAVDKSGNQKIEIAKKEEIKEKWNWQYIFFVIVVLLILIGLFIVFKYKNIKK